MPDKIHILLAITDSYAAYCAVTLVSLFENNKGNDFCIHIICADLSEANKNKLKRLFEKYGQEIDIIKPDLQRLQTIVDVKDKMPSKYHISIFYRLFAADWLPKDIKRVIYMDCDLIVTGNLKPLWEEDMDESVSLCATHDFVRIKDYHRLKIRKEEHTYFNSGVLLINLEYWRRQKVRLQCVRYLSTYPECILFPDQDALNVVSVGKVKDLHPKYNTMSPFFYKEEYLSVRVWYDDMPAICEAIKLPVIVHFAGEKPWFKGAYLPYRDEWMKYLAMTEWKSMKIKFKGGWKGRYKDIIRKMIFYVLGKKIKIVRLNYPIAPYIKHVSAQN